MDSAAARGDKKTTQLSHVFLSAVLNVQDRSSHSPIVSAPALKMNSDLQFQRYRMG